MKILPLWLASPVGLVIALSSSWCLGAESVPMAQLDRLPEFGLQRTERFESGIHVLNAQNKTDAIQGQRYTGFRFVAPPMLDGPIEWLSVLAGDASDEPPWQVLAADGTSVATLQAKLGDASAYSRIAAQFPQARKVALYEIPVNGLKSGQRYAVIQAIRDGKAVPLAVSITVNSVAGRFQYGDLNRNIVIPVRRLKIPEIMEAVKKAREETGAESAIAILKNGLDERVDEDEWDSLYNTVWGEAQFESGRIDSSWASMLNDVIYTNALNHRYYDESNRVTGNLISTLIDAERHGRKAEVMELWAESQRMGGYNLDPTSYPDLGPALAILPEVRKRKIPVLLAYSKVDFKDQDIRSQIKEFNRYDANSFQSYANFIYEAGHWREAMEWEQWIRDWASSPDGGPHPERAQQWYSSLIQSAFHLFNMEFNEEALALFEKGIAAPHGSGYKGRHKITLEISRLQTFIAMGRQDPRMIEQIEATIAKIKDHPHFNQVSVLKFQSVLAKAHIFTGKKAEGEALFEQLVKAGSMTARWDRLMHWVKMGRVEQVEEELLALLKLTRESGDKPKEASLYDAYAYFLETAGRDREAIWMRRECLRLFKSFDFFTKIPTQLARLAIVLERTGDADGSKKAADEARALLAQGRLPSNKVNEAKGFLARLTGLKVPPAKDPGSLAHVDFQPGQSVVIPIQGAPWTTMLTLANPSQFPEEGTLSANGVPVSFTIPKGRTDVLVRLGGKPGDGPASLSLRLAPGMYHLIKVTADLNFVQEGELSLVWTSSITRMQAQAKLQIDSPQAGVSSAVIQAGSYRINPFYGVPIHHHYVTKNSVAESMPMRFVASKATRVEVYDLDGNLLCVDAQGNGSLQDRSDVLYGKSDQHGNLILPLNEGSKSFMILAYPDGALPAEGLSLDIEVFQAGKWALYAQNKIVP